MLCARRGTARNSTSLALSTLKNLLAKQYLRRGDGLFAFNDSRRKERLFGSSGSTRLTLGSTGVKLELIGSEYAPRHDTCIKAVVRLLAIKASEEAA